MRCPKFLRKKDHVDILTNPKGVETLVKIDSIENSVRYHEAGYDALITGRCFLSLCQRLGRLAGSGGGGRILPNSPLLHPYLNKAGSHVKKSN